MLLKLKQDLSFTVILVFIQNVNVTIYRDIYLTIIPQLATVFKNVIDWPSNDFKIRFCFKNFTNMRMVLGWTEIPIQKFKCFFM